MLKKIGIGIVTVLVAFILLFGGFLAFITLRDYQPDPIESLIIDSNQQHILVPGERYTAMTFNIGYGALDRQADFFMDGGSQSRATSKATVEYNITQILSYITKANPNVLLIQELDLDSSRSFRVNQYDMFQQQLTQHGSTFAYNYKVDWVPVPVLNPMGKATSAISTFSSHKMNQSSRYALPGQESWPVQLFELDRCMIETRMPVENGRELVVINLHLSAFDEGGKIRQQQLSFLQQYLTEERANDNYIIVGGDWNHILPGTDPTKFKATEDTPFWIQSLPHDFVPAGYVWGVDANTPTVRTLASAYVEGENYLAVIDGFLVSDNVEIVKVYGTELQFEHTDHNPVTLEFVLK